MNPAYIYDTVRTPRGRGHAEKGALRKIAPIDLLKTVLDALASRNGLDTSQVDEIDLGCSTVTGEQGANLARIAPLYAGWETRFNGVTVSSFCTSGLEAIQMAAMKIMTGSVSCAVAGGVESMSRVPMFSDQGPWFSDRDVALKTHFIHMGLAADIVANLEGLTREDLDGYSIQSHRRALNARNALEGTRDHGMAYREEIIPVLKNGQPVLVGDEGIRTDISMEAMKTLPTIFDPSKSRDDIAFILEKMEDLRDFKCLHSVANAPLVADGASLLLMGNRRLGTKLGKKPIARISQFASASVNPLPMLTGVVEATRRLLKRSKLKLSDIDLFEVNESFAAVPLMFMKKMGVGTDRVNISGGAIALGHPLGATGGILIGTLIHNLKKTGGKKGIAVICGGAGLAQATLVEVL